MPTPGSRHKAQPKTPTDRAPQPNPPIVGRFSEQEAAVFKHTAPQPQLPEDEVQLQRDSELPNELVVRYVDGSGNLILQVPAEQVLQFERAIAAEFEKASAPRVEQDGQKGGSRGH